MLDNYYSSACCHIDPQAISFEGFDTAWERLINEIYESNHNGIVDEDLYVLTRDALLKGIQEGYNSEIGDYEIDTPDYLMHKSLNENIRYFSMLKGHQQIREAHHLMFDKKGNRRPFNKFRDDVLKLNKDYNQTYLRAEYNTTVSGAMMARKWVESERDKDTFPFLKYTTVGDPQVRPEHQLLDGIIKRVDDPFWDKYYPPNDWQCRCNVQRLTNSEETNTEGRELPALKEQFNSNIGKKGYIFPPEHPYFDIDAKEAKKAFTPTLQGRMFNIPTLGNVSLGSKGLKHIIRFEREDMAFQVFALENLNQLLNQARIYERAMDHRMRKDIKEVIKLESKLKGDHYKIIVRDTNEGLKLYDIGIKKAARTLKPK